MTPPVEIGIVGLGRLGLCLALNLERAGFHVSGFDTDQERAEFINSKKLKSTEPQVDELLKESLHFKSFNNIEVLQKCLLQFVVVPTNSLPEGGYDHQHIETVLQSLEAIGPMPEKRVIAINSTTMPGYCDTLVERFEKLNCSLVYNPEFIAQGSIIDNQLHPDQVLIGTHDDAAGSMVASVYKQMCPNEPIFCHMNLISAEMAKLATNCFLTMKISFANAMGDLATKAGAEPEKILAAVGSDSRIGGKYLQYGFGFGGPCFPRDNKALSKFAREQQLPLHLSEATDRINLEHLEFQTQQWLQEYPADAPIVFDSVTYKKGTDILEASQQLALAGNLARAGRQIIIREQPTIVSRLQERYGTLFSYEIQEG